MEDYIGRRVVHTTKKEKGEIVAQNKFYITVAFSPSGKKLITASRARRWSHLTRVLVGLRPNSTKSSRGDG